MFAFKRILIGMPQSGKTNKLKFLARKSLAQGRRVIFFGKQHECKDLAQMTKGKALSIVLEPQDTNTLPSPESYEFLSAELSTADLVVIGKTRVYDQNQDLGETVTKLMSAFHTSIAEETLAQYDVYVDEGQRWTDSQIDLLFGNVSISFQWIQQIIFILGKEKGKAFIDRFEEVEFFRCFDDADLRKAKKLLAKVGVSPQGGNNLLRSLEPPASILIDLKGIY